MTRIEPIHTDFGIREHPSPPPDPWLMLEIHLDREGHRPRMTRIKPIHTDFWIREHLPSPPNPWLLLEIHLDREGRVGEETAACSLLPSHACQPLRLL